MKQIYRNALSEVNAILINSNQNIINMIPNKFLDFVKNNMNQSYEIQIDLEKGILEPQQGRVRDAFYGIRCSDSILVVPMPEEP